VTVVDPSPDALAALTRRAADAGVPDRVSAVQGDGDNLAGLVPAGAADLVLCHSLLEVVDDPSEVLRAVAATLRPGGAASVLVAGQAHAVLARAMSGQLTAAAEVLAGTGGRVGPADTLRRRFDAATAAALLTGAGLMLEQIHGVRVLADLVPAAVADADPGTLLELETRLSARPPYRDIAAQLHLFARLTAR
jgi:SAM-dependent methyltransferase